MTRRQLLTTSAACLLLEGLPLTAMAAELRVFRSKPERVSLLELYTSEGCSSCPPADEWLSSLKAQKGLWTDFVPVAFHVDYWDDLGWKDPFGNAAHSQRQRGYAAQWRARTIYTPGFVLNGQEWRREGAGDLTRSREVPGVLSLTQAGDGEWKMRFAGAQDDRASPWQFHAVLLGFDLTTKVTRGENAGRTLLHDFVVLKHGAAVGTGGAATLKLGEANAGAVCGWVCRGDNPTPVQVVGGVL